MFRRDVKLLGELLAKNLRDNGLEIPLKQKRIISSWDRVVGSAVSRYTTEKYIRNQTLYVKISNAALRQDLSLMRSRLIKRLNEQVGALIISDIKIY